MYLLSSSSSSSETNLTFNPAAAVISLADRYLYNCFENRSFTIGVAYLETLATSDMKKLSSFFGSVWSLDKGKDWSSKKYDWPQVCLL
jgi:hypothetical protein